MCVALAAGQPRKTGLAHERGCAQFSLSPPEGAPFPSAAKMFGGSGGLLVDERHSTLAPGGYVGEHNQVVRDSGRSPRDT
jgi:hypothetical protein